MKNTMRAALISAFALTACGDDVGRIEALTAEGARKRARANAQAYEAAARERLRRLSVDLTGVGRS